VFPTWVFPNPKPGFLGYFLLPKTQVFLTTKAGYFQNLELLLPSNISNSDNTKFAEWHV